MFFKRNARANKPQFSLQAAQFAGLIQSMDLLERIRVTATKEEKESFDCGENFRVLDFYGVKHVEVTLEHLDPDKAKGTFAIWTPKLFARFEISLQRERTILSRISNDGFQEKKELDRWKPVQGSVWVHNLRYGGNEYSTLADDYVCIRDSALASKEDLSLKSINYCD